MKKALIIMLSALMLALLCACSGSNSEGPSETKCQIGDKVETDMVEFTLTEVKFTDLVGLSSENWLMPTNGHGGLTAGDGDTFVWLSMDVKNVSKGEVSGYDVTNITVDYDGGYTYGDGVYTDGSYSHASKQGYGSYGLEGMKALESQTYYGCIECLAVVRENRENPLLIRVVLPSSAGEQEFVYEYALAEGADTSAEALATSEALSNAADELDFVQKYAGNTNGNGSRKFADEKVEALRTSLSAIDMDYANANLPETAAAIPKLQGNIDAICDMLVEMGQTNSDANVNQIKLLAGETIDEINALLNGELSAFN